jgi:hypothetical protein
MQLIPLSSPTQGFISIFKQGQNRIVTQPFVLEI